MTADSRQRSVGTQDRIIVATE